MSKEYDTKEYDVCALGNAVVDMIAPCSEEFLAENNITKASMTLIERDRASQLMQLSDNPEMVSGGSAANSITGIAACGGRTAFMGKVSQDAIGKVFRDDMIREGVAFRTPYYQGDLESCRCHIFVTPDGERSMNTYLGSSVEFSQSDVDEELIKNSKITYLEGYLFDKEPAQKAFALASRFAHEANKQVAITLSDTFCVERHRDAFIDLIDKGIDILFANEAEICALAQTNDVEDAVAQFSKDDMILAVTLSEKGALIAQGDTRVNVPTEAVKVKDATGAGDQFAAGFLYGLTHGYDLYEAGALGCKMAGHIITIIGPRLQTDPKQWLVSKAA